MRTICVFNNKGGVGKTTLLCNLAAYFSIKRGKKVLVVDADPQCNATAYMIKEKVLDKLYASSSSDSATINSLIASLKKSKGYGIPPVLRSDGFNVDIVPGDPKFSLAEDFLAKDWLDAIAGDERGLRTTFFFRNLISWARSDGYDLVFFDMGPSLGAINRTVLLSSDHFILPMSSDIFSLRGLQNIEVALKNWTKGIKRGLVSFKEDQGTSFKVESGDALSELGVSFLGYVTQQYTAKTVDGKKQPVSAYEKIIKKIDPLVSKHLILPLNKGQKLNYKLGEIPYFQSLVPMAQTATVPIFALKKADGVVGAHFDKVRQFDSVISGIVDKIEANMNSKGN
ncbi:AAA family ATPase [Xanthomonas campestris]|uniref:ParA family protein n=1 Tax=Xanthomonas campestris TaxID=339 RepID=UPI002B2386DB|nr:AAA family ATPase [Xanthomonas campestris]MEB1027625.1 AAA family ATPase [Xanthomonas campestris pv. campestris]MEA9553099.1 AAA family ATPase [Xanthomonas campestris]MEB1098555.1 AAA family ATPase [Xanthomonas campestris pv. campestris]MEB1134994.1 AAA family ATPase [Xanthomonas campestris pv. campestris]MEB1148756.1 AAA family ATPase [Xanthomonas campestris pv. campestris]